MNLKIFSVGVIALALAACFHDSDDSPPPVTSVDVLTVSGVTMPLDGTWERPCDTKSPDGPDYLVSVIISGTSAVHGDYLYASNDGSCSGAETIDTVIDITGKAGAVTAITGWVDFGCVPAPPPQAKDGSGPLSNTESVTTITGIINSVTPANPAITPGMEVTSFYVVDDTVAGAPVMYEQSDCVNNNDAYIIPMTRK